MSHRIEKIESTLARAVQQVLARGLADPRAGGLISVTKIDVAPDLTQAVIHVSIFPEAKQKLTMHALAHAVGHVRRQAGDLMHLKKMPELSFRLDTTLKDQAALLNALNKATETGPAAREPGWTGTNEAPSTADGRVSKDDQEARP